MTTYSVNYDGGENVIIALTDFQRAGYRTVGTFEHDVDPMTQATSPHDLKAKDGTHVFVAKARKVLEDHDIDHRRLIFRDEATNVGVDNEMDMSTDALDIAEHGSDPEVSSQAGGETSVVGEDPYRRMPNGVSPASEAEPVSDTSGADTEQQAEAPADDATEDHQEQAEDTQAEEKAPEKAETVAELKARIAKITDKDELQKEYDTEQNGAKRATALKAIEDRAAELDTE